jgi:putative phage-type endonuclease
MLLEEDAPQGTEAWKAARCGSIGASSIADLTATLKGGGYGAGRANLMARIIAERLTGVPQDSYVNEAMAWGTATEAQARSAYAFMADVDVVEVGIIRHPTIPAAHASPDGLVGYDGLVEIKAPQTATHIETLLSGKVADRYVQQMQWQMACTDRQWCDYVSFDPRMPGDLQLFIKRFPRDDARISELEDAVRLFNLETQAKIVRLTALRNAA